MQIKGNGIEAIKFTQSADKILNLKPGANISIAAASGEITISAINTDTKVTSVDNHYSPTADSKSELTGAINGTAGAYAKDTEYTVLTGVKVQRDAKGHVTGITYTAQKIKDTNTTYTIPTKSSWDYDDRYVKYTEEQELDNIQKEQARSNIGAGTSNLTLAGNGSPTTAAKSDHNHDDKYLGKTAKAADSDKLDGKDSTYYLNKITALEGKPGLDKVGTVTSINANGTSFNPDATGKIDLGNIGGGSGPLQFSDVVVMTEAEFSEAYLAGTLQDDKLYLIEGETGTVNFVSTADHIVYNNANSGLTATNLQSAVDEINSKIF